MNSKNSALHAVTVELYLEVTRLRDELQEKLNCDEIEATLAARAILASFLHNLDPKALDEMAQFVAAVREKLG